MANDPPPNRIDALVSDYVRSAYATGGEFFEKRGYLSEIARMRPHLLLVIVQHSVVSVQRFMKEGLAADDADRSFRSKIACPR
jgi:hypothetical protein